MGLGGARRGGLDWSQVESVMRIRRIRRRNQEAMLEALREMETEALAALAELDG